MQNNMELFFEKYERRMDEPVIRCFLKNEKNKELLNRYIMDPSTSNQYILDRTFKEHYLDAKVKSYVNKLIYFFSIDFDKKVNLRKRRQLLIDHSSNSEACQHTYNSMVGSKEDLTYSQFIQNQQSLRDHLIDKKLIKALDILTDKQETILNLAYVFNMSNKEISELLNESPQTISYNHRTALKKLKTSCTDIKKL